MWTSSKPKKLKSDYDLEKRERGDKQHLHLLPLPSSSSSSSSTFSKRSLSSSRSTFSVRFKHLPRAQQYLFLWIPILIFLTLIHQLITHDILVIRPSHSSLSNSDLLRLKFNNPDSPTHDGAHKSDSDLSSNSISKINNFPPPTKLDIVISFYDQDLISLDYSLQNIRKVLQSKGDYKYKSNEIRTIIYSKSDKVKPEDLRLYIGVEAVIQLPNTGREGGTYLEHILEEYGYDGKYGGAGGGSSRLGGLSDHTLFVQSHLEYPWTALRRLKLLSPSTGFLSLGTYGLTRCGSDVRKRPDQNFPDFGRVFEFFRGKDCPVLEGEEGEQVMTYRGQFAASKERILANSKEKYSQLYYWLSNPPEPTLKYPAPSLQIESSPSNPLFGHTLERSWGLIFNCAGVGSSSSPELTSQDPNSEPNLARSCGDGFFAWANRWKGGQCQCYDKVEEDRKETAGGGMVGMGGGLY